MTAPVRIAVIGTGSIADAHLYAYSKTVGRAQVILVSDIAADRAQRAAERFGVPGVCGDYREVLSRADVDAVSICTPPFLHAEIAAACLLAGKHVLCEKPVAATLAELDSIETAEKDGGRVFSGVFQWRFGRGARQMRMLIDEGRLGRLTLGVAETLWLRDHPYYDDVAWRGASGHRKAAASPSARPSTRSIVWSGFSASRSVSSQKPGRFAQRPRRTTRPSRFCASPAARFGSRTIGNRLAVHPMEGCDGTLDGRPG